MASSLWSMVVMNRSLTARHLQDNNVNHHNRSDPETPVSAVDWDEWDDSLWTAEQRQWLEQGSVPREVYVTMSIVLTLVVVFGLIANAMILYVFSRFKRLRTPANVLVMNLTACDFISCLIHPMAIYSAYRGRWSFGKTGCNLYATCIGFLGMNSIVTLSAIACERYIVITSSSCRPAVAKWRITRCQAQKACVAIWLHCAALVAPPWMLGWSSYEPEGVLVTCSWDYTTRTLSNRLYYLYLLFFGFVLPVSVLTYCYAAIFRFIVRSSREMTRLVMASHVKSPFSTTTTSFRKRRRQTDVRTAMILLSLAILCFTAWTPYAIVSLIGQFGPVDEEEGRFELSPLATSIPAFLAKTAIVFDPLLYGFSHPQFRSSIRQILQQNSFMESSNNGPAHRGAGTNNKAVGGTTMMMVTGGLRHTAVRHPQYRSQSLHTSSAAVSWARNKLVNDQSISDHHPISSSNHSGTSFSLPETTAANRGIWTRPKRAMSLATIMWGNKNVQQQNKKKSGSSEAINNINRGASSCQEEVYRCFWSTARLSSVIRSKGDSFYLVGGTDQPPPSWMDSTGLHSPAVQLAGWAIQEEEDKKKKTAGDYKRRSSEPDLIRRRISPFALHNLRSVGDLTVRQQHRPQEPIFVVVSHPAGTTSSVIDGHCRNGPIDSGTTTTTTTTASRVSTARSAANLGHILWPSKRSSKGSGNQLFESRRQHSLVFDSRINNGGHQPVGHHNSSSCPLISPKKKKKKKKNKTNKQQNQQKLT